MLTEGEVQTWGRNGAGEEKQGNRRWCWGEQGPTRERGYREVSVMKAVGTEEEGKWVCGLKQGLGVWGEMGRGKTGALGRGQRPWHGDYKEALGRTQG